MRVMAKQEGFHTLVWLGDGPYPMDGGNCFGVYLEPQDMKEFKEHIRVLNMCWENFLELRKRGVIKMPVEIEIIEDRYCVIVDDRIPSGRLAHEMCTSCAPERLRESVAPYLKGHHD